jgi:hypothetical protein
MRQVRADLLIDANLLERVNEYAHRAGITPDEVFSHSAEVLLDAIERMTPIEREHLQMHALCDASGYSDYRVFASGRDACIGRFAFTVAILADMTPDGYSDRWCYPTIEQARSALEAWSGEHDTEPQGWHRHPTSGRRRPDGDAAREYIAV